MTKIQFELLILLFMNNFYISNCECNIDYPIYKDGNCQLIYCSDNEFEKGICSINNQIIKVQWLNNIIIFNEKKYRYCNFAINSKGDLIAEFSTEEENGIRLFYGLQQNGLFFFKDLENKETPIKNFTVIDNNIYPIRYESSNIFISINNSSYPEEYLISISLYYGYTEFFNFEGNEEILIIKTLDFTGYNIYSSVSKIIELNNNSNEKEYLFIFSGREKTNMEFKDFFVVLQKYNFYIDNESSIVRYSISKKLAISTTCSRAISGYIMNSSNLIVLFYLNYGFKIRIFDKELKIKKEKQISSYGNIDGNIGIFLKCIYIKKNLGAFIYYINYYDSLPKIKIEEINENLYNINEKMSISLDSTGYQFHTSPLLSDLIKIDDNRFSYIASSNDKTQIFILLFDLYNNDNNLKIRIYRIYLNELYNFRIFREITSILYNNYLTISSSVCNSLPCDYDTNENKENSNYFSFIIIFSYINGTDSFFDLSPYLIENIINKNNETNLILKLLENITIDNNIFGYELLQQIKIIQFPNELNFYNLDSDGQKNLVINNDILLLNHEIEQKLNLTKKSNDIYFIEYQFIVQEPEYEIFNQYPIKIIDYADNSNVNQKNEFEQKIFYGRINKVKFKLCNEFCGSCEYLGTTNNHKCLTCKENFEIDESGNCNHISDKIEEEYENEKKEDKINDNENEDKSEEIIIENKSNMEEIKAEINDSISFDEKETINIDKTDGKFCEKYYIEKYSNKKVCLEKGQKCPINFPFFNETSNQCMEAVLFEDLLKINFTLYNSSEENAIIYNLFKTVIIKNYSGTENLIITTEDSNVFQLTNTLNELNTKNGINSNNNSLSMIDLGECANLLKTKYNIYDDTPLIIFKLEKSGEIASKRNVNMKYIILIIKKK